MKAKISKLFAWGFGSLLGIFPAAALAAQSAEQRCNNFKAQFHGAFDWVRPEFCTAGGIGYYAIQLLLGLAGVAAVLFLILGGFWYLTSAGNEEQAEKGRKALINAVIGLVVIIMAVTIVRIVANALTSS